MSNLVSHVGIHAPSQTHRSRIRLLIAAAATMLLLLMAGGIPAKAAAAPWTGTVTLGASPVSTNVNAPNTTFTATLSIVLADPYIVTIYNDAGVKITSWTRAQAGTSRSLKFTYPTPAGASRSYRAYVAEDSPATGPPTLNLQASSAAVTVNNVGYNGTIALAASPTTTTLAAPNTTFTVTLGKVLLAPYFVSVYDNTGVKVGSKTPADLGTALTTTFTFATPPGVARSYTAYVSKDVPAVGPPLSSVKASTARTVTNSGWTGTVAMTAAPTTTTLASPNTTFTVTLNQALAAPYYLSIYNDLGQRVRQWTAAEAGSALTFTHVYATPIGFARTYRAYVSLDQPLVGPPVSSVKQSVLRTVTNSGWTGTLTLTSDHASTDANSPNATLTFQPPRLSQRPTTCRSTTTWEPASHTGTQWRLEPG